MPPLVRELDDACAPLMDVSQKAGARVWVVSEYGHVDVNRPVYANRILRDAGLLTVRPGPFGEMLDTFGSRALAVCDHQLAHICCKSPDDARRARDILTAAPGVAQVLWGDDRAEIGLDHPRAGELVALSTPDAWFAYPYWLDDRCAPDFARTVDIHRKPGYDPCELFFDPQLFWPRGRAMTRLLQKKLGLRTLFDVVPLDASLVKGSHGLPAAHDKDRPILIGDGPPPGEAATMPMTRVHNLLLEALVGEHGALPPTARPPLVAC